MKKDKKKTQKKVQKKVKKKGKGSKPTTTKTTTSRLTRSQTKDIENYIKKHVSIENIIKLQSIVRGQQTRKKKQKFKDESRLYKENLYKQSIGPKFYKTLEEIPKPILDKLLKDISKKYDIDNDIIGIMISNSIELLKIKKKIIMIMDVIKNLYGKILSNVLEWIDTLRQIRGLEMGPGSSDEEDDVDDWVGERIQELRSNMAKIKNKIKNLRSILINIITEFENFLILINMKNNDKINKYMDIIKIDLINDLDELEDFNLRKIMNKYAEIETMKSKLSKNISDIFSEIDAYMIDQNLHTDNNTFEKINKSSDEMHELCVNYLNSLKSSISKSKKK